MDSKMHKLWKLKYFCFSDTWKIYHSKRNRHHISYENTDQYRSKLQDSLSKMIQCSNNGKSQKSNHPVLPWTIIRVTCSARHIVNCCRIQGKSNGKDNCSCDQWWKKYPDFFYQDSHNKSNNATYDLRTKNRTDSITFCNCLHTWYISKTYPHDHRQSWT